MPDLVCRVISSITSKEEYLQSQTNDKSLPECHDELLVAFVPEESKFKLA
jgi:hypothetical protein